MKTPDAICGKLHTNEIPRLRAVLRKAALEQGSSVQQPQLPRDGRRTWRCRQQEPKHIHLARKMKVETHLHGQEALGSTKLKNSRTRTQPLKLWKFTQKGLNFPVWLKSKDMTDSFCLETAGQVGTAPYILCLNASL